MRKKNLFFFLRNTTTLTTAVLAHCTKGHHATIRVNYPPPANQAFLQFAERVAPHDQKKTNMGIAQQQSASLTLHWLVPNTRSDAQKYCLTFAPYAPSWGFAIKYTSSSGTSANFQKDKPKKKTYNRHAVHPFPLKPAAPKATK